MVSLYINLSQAYTHNIFVKERLITFKKQKRNLMSRRYTSTHESLEHESLKKEIKKQPHLIGLCDVISAVEEMIIWRDGGMLKAPDLLFHGKLDREAEKEELSWILVEVKSTRTRDNTEHAAKQLASGKRYLQDYMNVDDKYIRTLLVYREKDGEINYEELKLK